MPSRIRVVVAALMAASTLTVAGETDARADDALTWAGDWIVWEGYLTGEEAWIRLEDLPVDRTAFEGALPAWAERLRGLCDTDGPFYEGIAGYGGVPDPASSIQVLACGARDATSAWSPPFLVVGAMSDNLSPLGAGSPDLSLFGIGPESPESAPLSGSPSDRYFWGGTVVWTPTAENPQDNRAITGPEDWHGRCVAGPCAPGGVTPTSTTVPPPTLEQQKAAIGIENTGRDCDVDDPLFKKDLGYRISLVKTPWKDYNFLSWSSLPKVTEASAGSDVIIPEGYVVAALGLGADGRLREIVAEGPSTLTLPCEAENQVLRFLRNVNPFGTTTTLPGYLVAPSVGMFRFPWDLDPWEQVEQQCRGDDAPPWCYRPVMRLPPHVAAAVLGTAFLVEATDTETRVVVLDGRVLVTGLEAGEEVVEAGYEVTSDGTFVSTPRPADLAALEQQYPWVAAALAAEVDLPEFATGTAAPSPTDDGSGASIVPVALAGAAVVLAGLLVVLGRRQRAAAHPPPPPAPPPPPPGE